MKHTRWVIRHRQGLLPISCRLRHRYQRIAAVTICLVEQDVNSTPGIADYAYVLGYGAIAEGLAETDPWDPSLHRSGRRHEGGYLAALVWARHRAVPPEPIVRINGVSMTAEGGWIAKCTSLNLIVLRSATN